jgi:glycosyltransferase involved in cell wall biosynthesis
LEVIYSAAHAEFPDTEPLGGGKAVADYLIREWPGSLTVLSPARFGLASKLVEMSEFRYAKFCRQFERATTAEILKRDPGSCVVLCNDISEGPDFAALKSYRLVSIWHVDVVEYFTKFYWRGLVRPETAAKLPWPRIVFRKQRDCVRYSTRIVVPSAPMKEVILRCYPWCPAEKIVVLPWGNIAARPAVAPYPAGDHEFVVMTMSRLSPEKGIERLLRALPLVTGNYRVWICGAPAYMKGKRYERKLRKMADDRVEFLGHVTGARKAALLGRADLFVSPSRHESYGLTIAEAQAAGCRVISHHHYGASGTVVDCSDPSALAAAIAQAMTQGRTLKSEPARVMGTSAALRLAELLTTSRKLAESSRC